MQPKSKTVNQSESGPYSAANSTVGSEPWWNNTAYNSFCPRTMQGSVSDSSSAEQSGDVQSQSEGDNIAKHSPNSTPHQPEMDTPKEGQPELLPPPPPALPPNFVPQKVAMGKRVPMTGRGVATRGTSISLLVSIKYEDGSAVGVKGIGRKIIDRVHETYANELDGKKFAYDGEKSLFTIGPLPQKKLEFTVILDEATKNRNIGCESPGDDTDRKHVRRQPRSKTYNVAISFAAKIPMQATANELRGQDSEQFQEAVRVLDIILRQHAAQQGCLLVRQSFFHNDDRNFVDLGGGVFGCRGFHSSFRPTQGGLSLNMDVSTTMIVRPGPVIDFLLFKSKS